MWTTVTFRPLTCFSARSAFGEPSNCPTQRWTFASTVPPARATVSSASPTLYVARRIGFGFGRTCHADGAVQSIAAPWLSAPGIAPPAAPPWPAMPPMGGWSGGRAPEGTPHPAPPAAVVAAAAVSVGGVAAAEGV